MLNPDQVVTYFVAFLTVFVVIFVKISSLIHLMKEIEKKLHLRLFQATCGKDFVMEEEELSELLEMSADKLREHIIKKGLDEKEADRIVLRITSFRRFRIKYVANNCIVDVQDIKLISYISPILSSIY
jgi:hypothetical protein